MLESTSPLSSDTEEQKDCDEVENLDHAIDMTENYGVKQIDIDSIRQKCADDDTLENIPDGLMEMLRIFHLQLNFNYLI